jgi:hypothetical protein
MEEQQRKLKIDRVLTITSLLSVVFVTFHMAEDVARGFEPGGFKNVNVIVIGVVWLYGTVMLAGRRSGYIIMLLASLLGFLTPLAHMRGVGLVGGRMVNSGGKLFFVWTLIAVGMTSLFSVILAVRGLWSLPWRRRT